jgi:hypothetical protein
LKTEIFTDSNDSRSDGRTSTHPGTTIHHHTVISFSESPEQSRHCLLKLGLHLLARFAVSERYVTVCGSLKLSSATDRLQREIEIIGDLMRPEHSW